MKYTRNRSVVFALVSTLFVLFLILSAPKNPLTERNIGEPLDGFGALVTSQVAMKKAHFPLL